MRVAGAFGAGMARLGETCGAVTGAFMVIGLKHGKTEAADNAAKEKSYALARELSSRFKARNGSSLCRELLGHDLNTDEGMCAATERNLFSTRCPGFVRDAGEFLEELL
jgi:C_GCAxxG_C_C family probable redox protein